MQRCLQGKTSLQAMFPELPAGLRFEVVPLQCGVGRLLGQRSSWAAKMGEGVLSSRISPCSSLKRSQRRASH